MTYFPDFSRYEYTESAREMLNIGWLEPVHDFLVGELDSELVDALLRLGASPANMFRGIHPCGFCSSAMSEIPSPYGRRSGFAFVGSGEIHAVGADGVRYSAPTLVIHYVIEHGYQPPAAFVDAVLTSGKILDEAERAGGCRRLNSGP